jgi:hypothetical protein
MDEIITKFVKKALDEMKMASPKKSSIPDDESAYS